MIGSFTRVFLDKGFGFARGEDGLSYFVHASALQDPHRWDFVAPNVVISFDPAKSDKGNKLKAINAKLLNL